jgi:hypothetical protein
MKKMIFLAAHRFNDEQYQVGDEKKFTTEFNPRTSAKNKFYFPGDLLDLLVESKTVVVSDPDFLATETQKIMDGHITKTEEVRGLYSEGMISNVELLHRTIFSATTAMMDLNCLENRKQYEQDQIQLKVAAAKQKARKEGLNNG